jgi:ankyrin repeat protein
MKKMDSLLRGKRFFCREWGFSKINHCLENRPSAKTCGALVMGGPGCGKTALCCELVWPTTSHGKQRNLNRRLLAYHFCQAHDIDTLNLMKFIQSLVEQIRKSGLVEGYGDAISDPLVQTALETKECEKNPDEAFKKGILLPLLSLQPPPQNLFLLVDSIDESYLQSISDHKSGSRTIAELLANHHALFPKWLLLVCSSRKQSKSVTRMFTGFRKISLDDLRKSHVVRDVQQYILCRLDQEEDLRQHLSRDTAEMLNQLHIKSNGCFLYLEKVLDGVADNFIMLREIREIPGTLNGLYLWLCQRLFVRKQFVKIQPILNAILAARRPLTVDELYLCAWTRNTNLNRDEYFRRLEMLSKIIIDGRQNTKILFHHSFAEWLLDVKHCTQKYLCTAAEGHGMIAMTMSLHASSLSPSDIQGFALHLGKSVFQPPIYPFHLAFWMVMCGTNVEDSLTCCLPKEPKVRKLLLEAGARIPVHDETQSSTASSGDKDDSYAGLLEDESMLNQLDGNGRTLLMNAAYQGNSNFVNMLVSRGADLEVIDKNGQTALNLAARQGNADIVAVLLRSCANVDHTDNDGWTALRSAAWGGHTEVVGLLLEAGAQVDHADSDQRTALRAAAWGGHDEIVIQLLEHGADVNKIDNEGRTALIAAAYMGHVEIVEHLLEHSADINHEDCDGRTALSVAALCIPASQGHSGVVSLLLDRGAAVDHADQDGMTPLLVAAYEGHQEVCELLLENDADVDHWDHSNRTPLLAAASMGHSDVVNMLLFWGAAVDTIDTEGRTVLCIASSQGNPDVVRQLLERGLDEMHRDNAGLTPLHLAAFEGHKEVSFGQIFCQLVFHFIDLLLQ